MYKIEQFTKDYYAGELLTVKDLLSIDQVLYGKLSSTIMVEFFSLESITLEVGQPRTLIFPINGFDELSNWKVLEVLGSEKMKIVDKPKDVEEHLIINSIYITDLMNKPIKEFKEIFLSEKLKDKLEANYVVIRNRSEMKEMLGTSFFDGLGDFEDEDSFRMNSIQMKPLKSLDLYTK